MRVRSESECSPRIEARRRGALIMNGTSSGDWQGDESPSASASPRTNNPSMFQLLFERSADAIFLFDPRAGVFVDCNPAAVELMRAGSKERLLQVRPEELSPPLQSDGTPSDKKREEIVALTEQRGGHRFEWTVRRFDGQDVPMEVLSTAICVEGRSLHVVVPRDISERKRAERELLELNQSLERRVAERTAALSDSEARFGAAFQASPAFLGILDMRDEKYVLANEAYLNWLGAPLEEVLGRTCVEVGIWEDLAERDQVLIDIRDRGSIRQRECRWKNRHGERFTILLSAETITLNDTPHLLSMALDITQRKRAEEELRRTLEREKELGRLKSNFVSMVSHEFRTPLGIIQSSAELLRDFYQRMPSEEREEQLESIARNTRRMAGMMEQILALSRLEAGKLHFLPALLDLNPFSRRILDEILSATNRRCPVELSLEDFPANARADERLLGHIFTNLLSNAVKYSEPGAAVDWTLKRRDRAMVCTIRDRGIGISEMDQPHLFKAFHRGSNVGTRPGTGLGLLLVKRCVELHGGTVRVTSRLGEGTTAIVELPVFD
jgi:PAS domain S-box-containing protein